jgi:hypothetical protein
MNILETLQAICDDALLVAEKSPKEQQEVICALVEVIGKFIELPEKRREATLEERAANYALLLRQGTNINKLALANTLEDLAMLGQIKKMKAA